MTSGTEGRGPGLADAAPDRELWGRYVARGDRDAFAALVARHGPMVLGVCRRLLRHQQDAEDAFQATFLVLARKARSVVRPELLGPWLYGVAYRTALKARARVGRRREGPMTDVPAPESPEGLEPEVRAALDEELGRLPEKYRAPLVLCYLEGKSTQDAAQALGCPKGTVLSRLARGRDRLRRRLERRGLVPAGAALAAVLSVGRAPAAEVSADLLDVTVRGAGGGAAPVPARSLADEVLRGMGWERVVRRAAIGLLALAAVTAGAIAYRSLAARGPAGDAAYARDEDRLQGRWKVVAARTPGKDLVPAAFPVDRVVFRGSRVALESGGAGRQIPFRLDPAASPKAIDLTLGMDGASDVRLGIYALDDYTLTLCINTSAGAPRPDTFSAPPGRGSLLLTCQRERY